MKRYLGIGFFIHPLPLIAVALVALNDHVLKKQIPSALTGKLSDFAGLLFFPVFLCALWVLLKPARWFGLRAYEWVTRTQTIVAIAITDFIFVSIKVSPWATDIYVRAMGAIGYPSRVTPDLTDLWALSMNALTYWYLVQQVRRGPPDEAPDHFASK